MVEELIDHRMKGAVEEGFLFLTRWQVDNYGATAVWSAVQIKHVSSMAPNIQLPKDLEPNTVCLHLTAVSRSARLWVQPYLWDYLNLNLLPWHWRTLLKGVSSRISPTGCEISARLEKRRMTSSFPFVSVPDAEQFPLFTLAPNQACASPRNE